MGMLDRCLSYAEIYVFLLRDPSRSMSFRFLLVIVVSFENVSGKLVIEFIKIPYCFTSNLLGILQMPFLTHTGMVCFCTCVHRIKNVSA